MKQLKRFLLIMALILLLPTLVFSATATWTWPTTNIDGSTLTLTGISGFSLYNTTSGTPVLVNTTMIPTSNCTGATCSFTLPSTPPVGNTFYLTVTGTDGLISAPSNTATYNGPTPSPAGGLMIK